jgi:dimethylamine/trimethylamine dehydrogenase
VRDHREFLLRQMVNVEIYLDSELDADAVIEFATPHVFVATGSAWRRDGTGRALQNSIPGLDALPAGRVLSPDDIMAGEIAAAGQTVLYDDDHYLMGGVLAELLQERDGVAVTIVTPAPLVSAWTDYTMEQHRIQARLLEAGVTIIANHVLASVEPGAAVLRCVFTGQTRTIGLGTLVPVTARDGNDDLFTELKARRERGEAGHIRTLSAIGDCLAPGTVASAVYLGHLAARNLDGEEWDAALFRREMPSV